MYTDVDRNDKYSMCIPGDFKVFGLLDYGNLMLTTRKN